LLYYENLLEHKKQHEYLNKLKNKNCGESRFQSEELILPNEFRLDARAKSQSQTIIESRIKNKRHARLDSVQEEVSSYDGNSSKYIQSSNIKEFNQSLIDGNSPSKFEENRHAIDFDKFISSNSNEFNERQTFKAIDTNNKFFDEKIAFVHSKSDSINSNNLFTISHSVMVPKLLVLVSKYPIYKELDCFIRKIHKLV